MMLRDFPFIPYSKEVLSNSEKHANTHSNELKREQNTTLALRGHGHNSLKGRAAKNFFERIKSKPKGRGSK